jgi:hypothetical protein
MLQSLYGKGSRSKTGLQGVRVTIRHYQCPYPDEQIPPDMPIRFFYEVDVDADNVLRSVEIFADGSIARNSLEIEARHGQRWMSLSDGPFIENLEDIGLSACSADEFENAWANGKDTPFWNAPGNRFPPFS